MLITGAKEQEARTVAVRKHGEGDLGGEPLTTFVDRMTRESKPLADEA